MNIIIKDMEMPQNCYFCWLGHKCPKYESLLWNEINKKRKADCPLVEIPPHGDLIDRNALTDAIKSTDWYHQAPNKEMVHGANSAEHQAWYKEQDIYSALENAPTIIEAEEDE